MRQTISQEYKNPLALAGFYISNTFLYMLKFNSSGLLIPPGLVAASISEFEKTFVADFHLEHRQHLFKKYINYSQSLKTLCGLPNVLQWVNGSFTTCKPTPADIDLVTFIGHDTLERHQDGLEQYKYPLSKETFGVDAYIIRAYPPDHKDYKLFLSDRAYWFEHFSRTRRNRLGNKLPKGFVEINM